jgi:hypothetical protein
MIFRWDGCGGVSIYKYSVDESKLRCFTVAFAFGIAALSVNFSVVCFQRFSIGLRRSFDRQKKSNQKKTPDYVLILLWIMLLVEPVVAGSALMPIGKW